MTKGRPIVVSPDRRIASILSLLVLAGLACSGVEAPGKARAPSRPVGVPEEAVWSGGADGGAFLLLERRAEDPPHTYRARIYHDHSGSIWYEGRMALEPAGGPEVDVKDPGIFEGWDGESLHLKDRRVLKAIDGPPADGAP